MVNSVVRIIRIIIGMNFIFVDLSMCKLRRITHKLKKPEDIHIHFDAFKTRSSIVFMAFRFGDVNVSSKKRHVITQRRAKQSILSHCFYLSNNQSECRKLVNLELYTNKKTGSRRE